MPSLVWSDEGKPLFFVYIFNSYQMLEDENKHD